MNRQLATLKQLETVYQTKYRALQARKRAQALEPSWPQNKHGGSGARDGFDRVAP